MVAIKAPTIAAARSYERLRDHTMLHHKKLLLHVWKVELSLTEPLHVAISPLAALVCAAAAAVFAIVAAVASDRTKHADLNAKVIICITSSVAHLLSPLIYVVQLVMLPIFCQSPLLLVILSFVGLLVGLTRLLVTLVGAPFFEGGHLFTQKILDIVAEEEPFVVELNEHQHDTLNSLKAQIEQIPPEKAQRARAICQIAPWTFLGRPAYRRRPITITHRSAAGRLHFSRQIARALNLQVDLRMRCCAKEFEQRVFFVVTVVESHDPSS